MPDRYPSKLDAPASPIPAASGEYGLPVVRVELDSGPIDMAFGYVPVGVPAYSDVAPDLWPQPTHAEAEMVGAGMLAIGNWESFRIEKRWWPAAEWLVPSGGSRDPGGDAGAYDVSGDGSGKK